MDFKTSSKLHCSKNIPYVRTHEDSSDGCKQNHGSNFILQYRITFFAVLFSTLLLGCFIMIVIYFNMQTDRYSESLQMDGGLPHSSYISLDFDPETSAAIVEMAPDNDILISNIPFLQGEIDAKTRQKRQVNNQKDCKSRQKECRSILKAVREITHSISSQLEHLKNQLIKQNILSADDPQEVNYQKIYDCLQCGNTIEHKKEQDEVGDSPLPNLDHRTEARISEVLPYFDNRHFADGQEKLDSEEDSHKADERTERALTKKVMESVTTNSKVLDGAKVTEILHNTTIIEKDEGTQEGGGSETHVTRNMMGGPTPMIMPTAETTMIYQQDPFGRPGDKQQQQQNPEAANNMANIPAGLQPFILPTAESTKYSQQIQFAPQANAPSLIPICFYNNPPSGIPQQPFFTPQAMPPAGTNSEQIKFYAPNQPIVPPGFQSSLPAQFFQSSSAQKPASMFTQPPPFPMMNQSPQRNAPYYCTFIQAPNIPQQQQQQQQQVFPQMPMTTNFQNPYLGRSTEQKSKPKEKVLVNEKPSTPSAKSNFVDSDENDFFDECDGFMCPPPYRKCIPHNKRCDGRVDCIGAEDEIGCPIAEDNYYSRFIVDKQPQELPMNDQSVVENITKTITAYVATTTNSPIPITYDATPTIATTDSNDVETTTWKIVVPEIPKHFTCKRIIQTVALNKRCDGVFDCEDASDEEDCTCKDYLMLQRPFAVCDGHVDGSDGTDEEGCNFCRDDEYHCHRSGGCIPRQKMCNQANDCELNEDELDCFVLTDGKRVNLDLDRRPHLNLAGVLTRYERGAWRPSCFKSEYRSETKRMTAAQKICEYLGFRSMDSVNEVIVQKSKLEERSSTVNSPISYEYPPQFKPMPKGDNSTCYGLYIRCKPILDRKVNVHLKKNPDSKERSYLWPWEGSVFVDGKYRCPAVLLENDLLLASSKCAEHIDLSKNYTTAMFGVSSPDVPCSGPYQQTSQIVDIRPIKNSDASLLRLKDDVNMTRYVQPVYLEKRIFPASKSDSCVALGVTEQGQRKMKFLQPVVDNCPKCHRCYVEKTEAPCSKINETMNWSGNIVCLSANGGWYPTAVFQDKDENCGFSNKQTLNSIDYIHAHLSEAIDEPSPDMTEPVCDGVRCELGECVPWSRACDGVRDCRDGSDESNSTCIDYNKRCEENVSECKCSQAELRCGDGKCIPKEKFCDGKMDCQDGSDEPATCTCTAYLKLTRPKLVCDNRRHCLDKSDEDYRHCHCKDASFKCHKSTINGTVACISPDAVCDGYADCPEGEDESDATCNTIKSGRFDPHGKGELQKRSYGVWQSVCWPEPATSQSQVQTACKKMGYTTGLIIDGSKTAESIYVPRNDFYMFQPNNHTWLTMREDVSFGLWVKPNAPCYKLHIHCF